MCGICGFLDGTAYPLPDLKQNIRSKGHLLMRKKV